MKIARFITTAAAVAGAATVLTACGGSTGGSNAADKFVGHWDVKTLEAGEEVLDIEELYSVLGTDSSAAGLDLTQDGKMTLNIYGESDTTGTWKSSGNNSIVLTVEGDDQTATLEDGKLVMSYTEGDEKLTMTFVKADGTNTSTTAATTTAEETTVQETTVEETTAEETTAE